MFYYARKVQNNPQKTAQTFRHSVLIYHISNIYFLEFWVLNAQSPTEHLLADVPAEPSSSGVSRTIFGCAARRGGTFSGSFRCLRVFESSARKSATTGDENAAAAAEVVKNRITSRPFHERRRRTAPDDEMDTALRRRERSVNNASDDFHKSAKSYLAVGCGLSANLPGPSTRRHFRDLTVCVCGTAKTRS